MSLIKSFLSDTRGSIVADFAKSAVAIGILAVVAANFLHHKVEPLEKERMAEIAANAARGQQIDRSATGSIAREINGSRVDPCALPPKR